MSVFARLCLLILFCCVANGTIFAQGTLSIEPAGPPRSDIPLSLRTQLQATGTRLVRLDTGIRTTLYEVWWSSEIAVHKDARKSPGLVYRQLAFGTLLGVLYVPDMTADFYEHEFGPGFYTMRYAKLAKPREDKDDKDDKKDAQADQGDDEDALKASPYIDFVILNEAQSDTPGGSPLVLARLRQFSRHEPASKPALLLSLVPINPLYKGFPSVVADNQGNCAVQFRLQGETAKGKTTDLDLSILLITPPNFGRDD